jgi:hypothetical protein
MADIEPLDAAVRECISVDLYQQGRINLLEYVTDRLLAQLPDAQVIEITVRRLSWVTTEKPPSIASKS